MASPVKDAKLHHQGRGFTEVAGRGRGHLLSRKPGTEQYALTTQVGGIGWHKGQGPFSEADEIDTAWVASGGLWDWEMTQADYQAYIRDSVPVSYRYVDDATGLFIELTASQPVWVNDEGQSQNAASFSQVTPAITDDLISWANIAPGWSFRVRAQTARLAKLIDIDTLASLGAPTIGGTNERLRLQFTYTRSSGMTIWLDGVQWNERNNTQVETYGNIEFRSGDTPIFWIRKPMIWGADGDYAPFVQRVRRTGVNFYVEIDIPWTWLQSAVYPITIDPTVDTSVTASGDDGYHGTHLGCNDLDTGTGISVFGYESGWMGVGNFHRFQNITISSGATIDVAYMTFVAQANGSSTTCSVTISANDDSGTPAAPTTCGDITGATQTTNTVNWTNIASWTAGNSYNSPSIVSIIQELVDSYGSAFDGGTADVLLYALNNGSSANAERRAASWDDVTYSAPALHIEYTAAAAGRTTKNTVSNPLGLSTAIGWRIRPA